jgi:hypothetical protein
MDFDRKDQPGFDNLSFDRPTDMLGEAVRRFAGQPFPAELQRAKDALFNRMINLEDNSARVSISPTGRLYIMPKASNWNMELDPMNKGIQIGYDSRQTQPMPQMGAIMPEIGGLMPEGPVGPSAGRTFADEMIRQYQEQNPDWYRR